MFEAINRKFMRMTEPEVREVFAILDLQVSTHILKHDTQWSSYVTLHIYKSHVIILPQLYCTQPTHRNKDSLMEKWHNNGSILAK
jgi:hypothetical protein